MPNGWQWVIKRGENSLTLSHLNNIRFGCEDALMRILKAKPKKILDFLRESKLWGNEIEPSKAKLLPTTKWRNNDDSDLPCEPKNHRVEEQGWWELKAIDLLPAFCTSKRFQSWMKKIKQKIHTKCALKWPPVGINLDTLHTTAKTPISVVKIENVIFGMHFVFAIKYVYLLAIKYVTKHLTSRICLSTFDNCNFENTCVSMRKIALNLVGKTNSWLKA